MVIGWDRTGAYEESSVKYDFVIPLRFPEDPVDADGRMVYFQQISHMWNCFRALLKPMWKLRNNYDYIHNFNSGFAFNRISIFIGKLLGKKVITETSLIGDDDPVSLGRFPEWKDYLKPKFIRYQFYKMADRYVSKSEFMTGIFKSSEIPISKVAEIPYSVDVHRFCPIGKIEKTELRKKLGLWDFGTIILFVGGINVRKGVHHLVNAFIKVEKEYPDVRLLIVGPTYKYDPGYILNLKEKIRAERLEEKVILTEKNVNNVEEYMQSSDFFVLPSKQEGFPISIVEAMSAGLVVFASDIPEISNAQITNGIDGLLFQEGNSNELAKCLTEVVKNNETAVNLGKEARRKAVEKWSTEIVDNQYKQLYESI